jgi:hypothetical protein
MSRLASPYRVTIANRRGPSVSSVVPQILPCSAPRVLAGKFPSSSQPPVECLHHLNAHCSVAARRCSSQDARARSSTTRSRAGCLMLPRPILSLLADDCGSYHHLTSVAPSPFRCSTVPSLRGRDARARSSTTMSHTVPLLPPSLLTPCAARPASSTLAPRCVGTIRWHACVCRVAASIRPLVQLTSSPTAYGQTPYASPPRKAAATMTSLMCLTARASTLALPPRCHLPLSLIAQAHIART